MSAGRRPVREKQEGLTRNGLRLARASPARYTGIDMRGTREGREVAEQRIMSAVFARASC